MKKSQWTCITLVMLILNLSSNLSLAGDLSANLKPQAADIDMICLNREEAERAQVEIQENASCHRQLKSVTNTDWITLIEVSIISGLLGVVFCHEAKCFGGNN